MIQYYKVDIRKKSNNGTYKIIRKMKQGR